MRCIYSSTYLYAIYMCCLQVAHTSVQYVNIRIYIFIFYVLLNMCKLCASECAYMHKIQGQAFMCHMNVQVEKGFVYRMITHQEVHACAMLNWYVKFSGTLARRQRTFSARRTERRPVVVTFVRYVSERFVFHMSDSSSLNFVYTFA